MNKIVGIFLLLLFSTALYLMLSVFGVPVPLPKWYEQVVKEHVDSSMAHDPFLNLAKTTCKFRTERDSLQKLVDSLRTNTSRVVEKDTR